MIINEKVTKDMISLLFSTILKLTDETECQTFFADLCTANEIDQMAQRITAAKLLLEGKTYTQIIEMTDISSATLSRISNAVKHGNGGYKKLLT